jgi:transposase-like protein
MSAEDFSHLACPNADCSSYGQRGSGNLRPHGWSTKDKSVRCLRCTTCGQHFSERANTPLFGLRTSEDTLVAIARHLAEGVGCRATARLTGVTLNTVLRFTQRFGKHAELFHDSMVRGIQPKQIQADEAWSFVGKKGQAPRPG